MIKVGDLVRFNNKFLRECHNWRFRKKYREKNWFRRKNLIMRVVGDLGLRVKWFRGQYDWNRLVEVEAIEETFPFRIVSVKDLAFVGRPSSADAGRQAKLTVCPDWNSGVLNR